MSRNVRFNKGSLVLSGCTICGSILFLASQKKSLSCVSFSSCGVSSILLGSAADVEAYKYRQKLGLPRPSPLHLSLFFLSFLFLMLCLSLSLFDFKFIHSPITLIFISLHFVALSWSLYFTMLLCLLHYTLPLTFYLLSATHIH